jgi:hypothetical protein
MGKDAIVAGTGFLNPDGSSRVQLIRKHCKNGMPVQLKRDPTNPHDSNAIAVLISVPRMFGLLGQSLAQIGFIKAPAAKGLAAKMDAGTSLTGYVKSFYAPIDIEYPRVSLRVEWADA